MCKINESPWQLQLDARCFIYFSLCLCPMREVEWLSLQHLIQKSELLRKPTQERFVCGDPRVLVLSFSVPFKMSFDSSAYINKDVV